MELLLCGISLLVLSLELFFLPVVMGGIYPSTFGDVGNINFLKIMLDNYFHQGYSQPMLIPVYVFFISLTVYLVRKFIQRKR